MGQSHFFAFLGRMKFIQRWGLMRNSLVENVQEHSLQVAMIAHSLALIGNRFFNGSYNPDRVSTLALFHDAEEVITGDLATPVKYFNPEIKDAYKRIEQVAREKLFQLIPDELKEGYQEIFFPEPAADAAHLKLVKAADKICAYLKCLDELNAGNAEFTKAKRTIEEDLQGIELPEVTYFMETFAPSFRLSLDELNL